MVDTTYVNNPLDRNYRLTVSTDPRDITLWTDILVVLKEQLRISFDFDDNLLTMYARAAVGSIEQYLYLSIAPRAFTVDYVGQGGYTAYALPMRNAEVTGQTTTTYVGFEPLLSYGLIDPPAAWPIEMQVGFVEFSAVPADLGQTIVMLAATYYEQRLTTEHINTFPPALIYSMLPRYKEMSC
jgi:hypothetical protein